MPQDILNKSPARVDVVNHHLSLLLKLGILTRVVVAFLALLASSLPAFDSSAEILLEDMKTSFFKRWIASSLRWDAFHFLHVARQSYEYEHDWAFLPGVPLISRVAGETLDLLIGQPGDLSMYRILLGHFLTSTAVTVMTVRTLYRLTLAHTLSPSASLLAACLSLLSSSPATLHLAPYAEPWFALLSYHGMLHCAQKRWLTASVLFALAATFRSNGILLGGFIIWGMLIEPFLTRLPVNLYSVLYCITLSALPCIPSTLHQLYGYRVFCTGLSASTPSWCTRRLPLIYAHVQSYYWNFGFLRYWAWQQLPNFLISAPVLLLLLYSSITYIMQVLPPQLGFSVSNSKSVCPHPLLFPSFLPHAIHSLIVTCILLFASHTQIILRLASSMPFMYWSATRLFIERPRWAKAWTAWSVVWGATSVVLWTVFLPPA